MVDGRYSESVVKRCMSVPWLVPVIGFAVVVIAVAMLVWFALRDQVVAVGDESVGIRYRNRSYDFPVAASVEIHLRGHPRADWVCLGYAVWDDTPIEFVVTKIGGAIYALATTVDDRVAVAVIDLDLRLIFAGENVSRFREELNQFGLVPIGDVKGQRAEPIYW